MSRINSKKNLLLTFVILLILIIGIGYAFLTSNLSISGNTEIGSNTMNMFDGSTTTTGYARTQADANKFNSSSSKPSGLTFVLKN